MATTSTTGAASAEITGALPSLLDDDFVVINDSSPSDAPESVNPYEMPLPSAAGGSGELQVLSGRIVEASQLCDSLRAGLGESNASLQRMHDRMSEQDKQLISRLALCQQLQAEVLRLSNSQEEWQQTANDYMALKNQYNLLANTTDRLQAEKAELQQQLQQQQRQRCSAAEPAGNSKPPEAAARGDAASEEQLHRALEAQRRELTATAEAERRRWEAELLSCRERHASELADLRQQMKAEVDDIGDENDQMKHRVCELEAQLLEMQTQLADTTAANEQLRREASQTEEQSLRRATSAEQRMLLKMAQLESQVEEWKGRVEEEQAKTCEAEKRHRAELDDLRKNSQVRQLGELRLDLERRKRREEELGRLYGENDQTVNDIIRASEKDMKQALSDISALKLEREALQAALAESCRRAENFGRREMEMTDEIKELNDRLTNQAEEHNSETRQIQEELWAAERQHQTELESIQRSGQFRDAKLQAAEKQLEEARREVERLKKREEELIKLCVEGDQAVNDIIAATETDKRNMQDEIATLRQAKEALQTSLQDTTRRLTEKEEQHWQLVGQLERVSNLRGQAEQQLQRRTQELTQAMETVSNLQRHAENLQAARMALEQQVQDLKTKSEEAINMAGQLREQLYAKSARATGLDAELSKLKLEHTRLRANYSDMEHSVPQLMAREHELQTCLSERVNRLSQAEGTLQVYATTLEENEREFAKERAEKEKLRQECESLRLRLDRLRVEFEH